MLEENSNYKNFDLNLYTFAKMLGLSPRALSKIIHDSVKIGFRQFLNQFRIKKAIEFIQRHKDVYRVQKYAALVGYSSRVAFLNDFKNHLGQSPEIYLKLLSNIK
ncbi:AraC-type DNA-binding protein [Belliella buryatensis]|uniref:AraC-type DNA-binding protein n=1 Tax=Belliella buryatensis TaxID=1500549 RepID=A0A239GLE6_9BACT|nr:helix-turn-helix domain-containing protein [Belliella buryatensis]SNS69940.1 AraC-type DNA-binding protein [Belliella buryatensis]